MHGVRLRLLWTAAVAFVAAWLLGGSELNPRALPAFAIAAVIAYVTWPAFVVSLPPSYALRVTSGGIVAAMLVGLVYAAVPVVRGTEAVSIMNLAARFAGMVLLAFAAGVVFSVLGARVFNRQPADR